MAQRKMHFASSLTVTQNQSSDVFNSLSLYVPASFAYDGIVGWNGMKGQLSATIPVVLTVTASNYNTLLQGNLLFDFQDAFNSGANVDFVLYVIVFDDAQTGEWTIGQNTIAYTPLTLAFRALYFISYFKMVYDWNCDGNNVVIPFPGTYGQMTVTIANPTGGTLLLPAGTYQYNDGTMLYNLVVAAQLSIPAAGSVPGVVMLATTVGVDASLTTGAKDAANFSPLLTTGLTVTATAVVAGQAANPTPAAVPTKYFDQSLAMAQLCSSNLEMSLLISLVKVAESATGFPVTTMTDPNPCMIRSLNAGAQEAAMKSLAMSATGPYPNPRTNLYWGALYLISATNTWVIAHTEPFNIVAEVIAAWMGTPNASGEYVGNKLSHLRLAGGSVIKPFGYPSWLNNAMNQNDAAAFDNFDAMNIAYLCTISDSTAQDCWLSSAKTVTGFPVTALMIEKWVDYRSAQQVADMIAADGTLANPVLTDADAYKQIQNIVGGNLTAMSKTGRLVGVSLNFPSLGAAKVSANALSAASAWHATYIDDLDSVTVSGGISA